MAATLAVVAPRGGGEMNTSGMDRLSWPNWLGFAARQLWLDAGDIDRLLGSGWAARLAQQIHQAESGHPAELGLCVEAAVPWAQVRLARHSSLQAMVRRRAVDLFGQLGIWDTEHNSGVLIYVLLSEHAIEIVADRGLRSIDKSQWQTIAQELAEGLQTGLRERALSRALERCGNLLAAAGLVYAGQGNELPDTPHVR